MVQFPLLKLLVFRSAKHLGDQVFAEAAMHASDTAEDDLDTTQQCIGVDALKLTRNRDI